MSLIRDIRAREILDSRGKPTIEVAVYTNNNSRGIASVPSGISTGTHEAKELRDKGKRYHGLGVRKAVSIVETIIKPLLCGIDPSRQREIDSIMIEKDGFKDKHKLGANTLLAISLACARAAAADGGKELYLYLSTFPQLTRRSMVLPRPYFNVINGGKHASSALAIQECMIVPNYSSCRENLRASSEIYHALQKLIHTKYGSTGVGDEGGFAPPLKRTEDALQLLRAAILTAGYRGKVDLALDCAASSFYKQKNYHLERRKMNAQKLLDFYLHLIQKYNIISIEDPFHEEDFTHYAELRRKTNIQIVGDDLTTTNLARIRKAIEAKSCTCLLLKPNQIGTLTEALDAAQLAFDNGWKVMVSHRSGETNDAFIADLAVALGCGQIKAGAPCRGERLAKYNRLLEIEEMKE
ncbi:phosphopyruvate hydratase [Candidatus Woesearchaeota archaeon]|nr:phosphopyruvate hydratase [Candidatus Woesearchaeota archaeon]